MGDYEALKKICDDAEQLANDGVTSSDPNFKAWKTRADRFLIKHFGEDSYEFESFKKIHFSLAVYAIGTPEEAFIEVCSEGLRKAQAILTVYLDDFEDSTSDSSSTKEVPGDYSRVFVVHGHDGELKEKVARLIEKQGLRAVILNEQANAGLTIIEKLERESSAAGAVCLFTADDVGKGKTEQNELQKRPRQNVIFETGFFIGRLGREHVVVLSDSDIELPSDMQGIVYTGTSSWELSLLKELRNMGYPIDMNLCDL